VRSTWLGQEEALLSLSESEKDSFLFTGLDGRGGLADMMANWTSFNSSVKTRVVEMVARMMKSTNKGIVMSSIRHIVVFRPVMHKAPLYMSRSVNVLIWMLYLVYNVESKVSDKNGSRQRTRGLA